MTAAINAEATPKVLKAYEDAERTCPTDTHRYGYMVSVAQRLEIELDAAKRVIDRLMPKRDDLTVDDIIRTEMKRHDGDGQ